MAWLDAVILVVVLVCHKRLLAICLDEQQAELQGDQRPGDEHRALVPGGADGDRLTQVVGLILVIALLSLPAATAAHHVKPAGRR